MKNLFLMVFFLGTFACFNAYAEDSLADFDDGTDIKPLTKELSVAEADKSTELDNVDYGQELPELSCSDENLKKQIANFIYSYINRDGASSVIEQRTQHLLVRNLHGFTQVEDQSLSPKDNYSAVSVLAYLKINQNKKIYKICQSNNNKSKKFADLFAIIYRDGAYYQVVIPNVILSTKDIDKATFVYNW